MKKLHNSKALLLDLRGNGGGAIDALRTLAGWLFDRDVLIATEKTRKAEQPIRASRSRRSSPSSSNTSPSALICASTNLPSPVSTKLPSEPAVLSSA